MFDLYSAYVTGAIFLAAVAFYGLVSKRNILKMVICLEMLTCAVNLLILCVGLTPYGVDAFAQSMVVICMAIAACIGAVALALVIDVYRIYRTLDTRKLRRLRW